MHLRIADLNLQLAIFTLVSIFIKAKKYQQSNKRSQRLNMDKSSTASFHLSTFVINPFPTRPSDMD